MVGGETVHILRSPQKLDWWNTAFLEPWNELRDSRLWNNGRESWQLVTNVFQGWANPNPFLTILEYCIRLQY